MESLDAERSIMIRARDLLIQHPELIIADGVSWSFIDRSGSLRQTTAKRTHLSGEYGMSVLLGKPGYREETVGPQDQRGDAQ